MLARLIVDWLIASLLLLAVGWVSDILHASTHNRLPRRSASGLLG
jgi:hypothetical protein